MSQDKAIEKNQETITEKALNIPAAEGELDDEALENVAGGILTKGKSQPGPTEG